MVTDINCILRDGAGVSCGKHKAVALRKVLGLFWALFFFMCNFRVMSCVSQSCSENLVIDYIKVHSIRFGTW